MSDGMDSGSSDSGSNDSGSNDAGGGWSAPDMRDGGGGDQAISESVGANRTDDSPMSSGEHHGAGHAESTHRDEPPPAYPGDAPPPPAPPNPPFYPAGSTAFPAAPPPTWRPEQTGPNFASWGIRLGGYVIDFVIFAIVTLLFVVLMRHSHGLEVHFTMKRGTNRHRSFSAVPFVISGLLYIVYGTVFCGSRRGQTIGMMAVGVRAVRDQTFERLGYGRAFGRALFEGFLRALELLSLLLGVVWLVDMLFPLWDKRRQTLHDKVVGSVVLRDRPSG